MSPEFNNLAGVIARGEMTNSELEAETLKWCNERRAERGIGPLEKLPKGKRRDPHSCPCGAACGLWVETFTYGDDLCGKAFPLPAAVSDFVVKFDKGEFPHLELR